MIPWALPVILLAAASGQPLSDRTGLVSTVDIETHGEVFEVRVVGNFDVADHAFVGGRLLLVIESSLEGNIGEVVIPSAALEEAPSFYLNTRPLDARVAEGGGVYFATLEFAGSGRNEIEVSGFASDSDDVTDRPERPVPWWAFVAAPAAAAAAVAVARRARR